MPPFMQLRLWLREGPVGERVLAGIGALLMLAVLGGALAPVGPDEGRDELLAVDSGGVAPGAAPGEPAPGLTGGAAPGAAGGAAAGGGGAAGGAAAGGGGSAAGGAAAGGGGGAAAPQPGATGGAGGGGAAACGNRGASAPGITKSEVRIAMSNISLAGPIGNSTFDLRPDLEDIANALAKEINDSGGLACGRKLVLRHYDVNPIDSNDTQAKCLEMVEQKPFMVIDYGGYVNPASRSCFVNARVPLQTATSIGQTEARGSYPYLFAASALSEQLVRNGVHGLNARGFFKAPKFKKLGLLADSCDPAVSREFIAALAKVGVRSSQISRFDLGCAVSAPPNQIQQAVLQHRSDGVTHVMFIASVTNNQNYVRVAANQDFRPIYGLSDYGGTLVSPGSGNWDRSFEGSVGITTLHTGEVNSGIKNAQTEACDKTLRKHGVPGIRDERKDTSAMVYCDLFSLFKQAIDRAGANPTRLGTIQALSTMGQFRSSLLGDGNFNRPGKVTGGDVQRAIQWRADCTCWKVLDRTYRPGY